MASKQANRQAITLKGSTTLVTEFFKYAVNTYVESSSPQSSPNLILSKAFSFNAKFTHLMTFIWWKSMARQFWWLRTLPLRTTSIGTYTHSRSFDNRPSSAARPEFSNRFKVSVKCWMVEPFIMLLIEWLLTGSVTQLVLAIISKDTRTPLERWVFDIKLVEQPADSRAP